MAALAERLDASSFLPGIVSALTTAFEAGEALPSVEDLQEKVPRLVQAIAQLPGVTSGRDRANEVARRIVNAAYARFLAAVPFDFKRTKAVAALERDVDWHYLPACFVRELQDPTAWTGPMLRSTVDFEAKDSEDDRDLLQQELVKWREDRQSEVPRWRSGNLMSLGIQDFLLVGALLRALDEKAWLRFLDKQPLAAAVETLLWQAQVEQTPTGVLRLLALSDVAFDASGNRTESVAVYFILDKALSLVEEDLDRRLRRDVGEDETKRHLAEQDGLLREIVNMLGSRNDSQVLLVELGADYLLRAQTAVPEFGRMRNRFAIYTRFVEVIGEKLGNAETVVGLARERAGREVRESRWGLWLLATNSSCMPEAIERSAELQGSRQELWEWLQALMLSSDRALHDRYSTFPDWVASLVGFTLAKLPEAAMTFEGTWKSLTAQRLEQVENKYEKDTWRLSKLLCRSGFLAARHAMPSDAARAAQLWKMSMAMGITAWLSSTSTDSFSEVHYGLCHFAAGAFDVSEEPKQTLAYLRGEPELLARAAIDLKSNGWDAAKVAHACAAVGIDVVAYLQIARNAAQLKDFGTHLDEFRKAADSNWAAPSEPTSGSGD